MGRLIIDGHDVYEIDERCLEEHKIDKKCEILKKIENAKKDLGYKPEFSYIRYLEDYKKEQKLNRFAELWRK